MLLPAQGTICYYIQMLSGALSHPYRLTAAAGPYSQATSSVMDELERFGGHVRTVIAPES